LNLYKGVRLFGFTVKAQQIKPRSIRKGRGNGSTLRIKPKVEFVIAEKTEKCRHCKQPIPKGAKCLFMKGSFGLKSFFHNEKCFHAWMKEFQRQANDPFMSMH